MVPLGVTRRGEKWISLLDADSVLIGGTRQMGKMTLLHSWILLLITAEDPDDLCLVLCDGKDRAEFGRYVGVPHVVAVAGRGVELAAQIDYLRQELVARSALLRQHGVRNVKELATGERPPFLVLVVDELAEALAAPGVEEALKDLVARGGAYGVLPVLTTQRPDSTVVAGFLKCNMATRISLPVPALQDSKVILPGGGGKDRKVQRAHRPRMGRADDRGSGVRRADGAVERDPRLVGGGRAGRRPAPGARSLAGAIGARRRGGVGWGL